LTDAREALINAVVDMLTAYRSVQGISQSTSQLPCPYQLRHVALYVLAMLKSVSPLPRCIRTLAHSSCSKLNIYLKTAFCGTSLIQGFIYFCSLEAAALSHAFH